MLKLFTVLLLTCSLAALALAETTAESPDDELKDLMACGASAQTTMAKCTADLPPMVKVAKNLDFLKAHPELCCPTYQAFLCMKDGLAQVAPCKRVWSKMEAQFEVQMSAFPANGCNVQTCK